jgi:outer membrane receptor protein involved in Fe transport
MRVFTILLRFTLISFIFIFFVLPNNIFSQTTGSIGGTVIDAKDKTPIVGAIVKIEGTSKGVETDANGNYVILNMDVGTYSVACSYVGYNTFKQTGVKVSVDQRTKVNFEMAVSGIEIQTIEIVAQRKGIDVEQSGRLIDSSQVQHEGIRGISNIVGKTAGVIQDEKGGVLNIRGGRSSENLIIVDGIATMNPIDGSSSAYVSNAQIQEIAVLTGGFGAEYGNALSGVINVTTKSGSDVYSGSAEVESDALAGKWIKTTSQGYNLYNATLGGPLIPTKALSKVINFYGGIERHFLQVESPSWIGDQNFPNGIIPGIPQYLWSYNGRLNIDLSAIKNSKVPIQLKGGITYTTNLDYTFQGSRLKYDYNHFRYNNSKDMEAYGRIIHTVTSKFYYELQFNYYRTQLEFGDPQYKSNYFLVGDVKAIPHLTTQGGEVPYDTIDGVFRQAGSPYNFFHQSDVSYLGGKLDATWALLTKKLGNHEIKFGGEFKYHYLKKFEIYTPVLATHNYDTLVITVTGTDTTRTHVDPHSQAFVDANRGLWYAGSGGNMSAYGYSLYDQFGNSIVPASDVTARHPMIGAFYVRDKVDFKDFSFNGGIRIDYLNANYESLISPTDLYQGSPVLLSDAAYQKSKAQILVSPRLGFSFPVTDKTVFVAQFGKFVQMPPLDELYTTREAFQQFFTAAVQNVSPNSALKPEKLTSYEVGIKQTVGDFLNMGITAYYKETQDQIGVYRILQSPTVPRGYTLYENSDFSVSRGLDFYLSLRRFKRFAVDVAYTLLYASGTGSDPNQKLNLVNASTLYPNFTFPLNFDQRHTGSINFDYRFGGDNDVPKGVWGKILRQLGLNILFNFNSGRPYTSRDLPPAAFSPSSGMATAPKNSLYWNWNFDIDLKIDKTVPIWKTNWNFYIYVTNLLNNQLINAVYEATGRPDGDGYFSTPYVINATPQYLADYTYRIQNPFNWGPPRQVRFGVKLNF